MRDGWGIVTDRDLRSRVLASRRSPDTPPRRSATFPVKTLPEKALVGEALLEMFAEGVHHFPVTRPDGSITGVITDTDLMDIGRDTPFSISSAIERAQTRDDVVGRRARATAGRRSPSSTPAPSRWESVASWRSSLTRSPRDCSRSGSSAPANLRSRWAWLALGSAARREQALGTDQLTTLPSSTCPMSG